MIKSLIESLAYKFLKSFPNENGGFHMRAIHLSETDLPLHILGQLFIQQVQLVDNEQRLKGGAKRLSWKYFGTGLANLIDSKALEDKVPDYSMQKFWTAEFYLLLFLRILLFFTSFLRLLSCSWFDLHSPLELVLSNVKPILSSYRDIIKIFHGRYLFIRDA